MTLLSYGEGKETTKRQILIINHVQLVIKKMEVESPL